MYLNIKFFEKLKIFQKLKSNYALCLVVILLVALTLRVLFIWNRYLGNDEPYTVDWVSHGLNHFIQVTLGDTSPPLFYFLAFGAYNLLNLYGFYLLVIFFGVLSIFVLYKVVALIFDRKIALLSVLLFSISTMHILYSQHIRPYTFVQFFVLFAIYISLKYFQNRKGAELAKLSVIFVILLFTYYPAIVPLLIIYAVIFYSDLKKKTFPLYAILSLIPVFIAGILVYIFFIVQIVRASTHNYSFPLVENFFYFFYKHFAAVNISTALPSMQASIVLGIILCVLFAAGLIISKRKYIPLIIFGSIGLYYLVFLKFSSIIYFKHMSAIMPLIYIFPAVGLMWIWKKNKIVFYILLITIIILSFLVIIFYYQTITLIPEWTPIIGH